MGDVAQVGLTVAGAVAAALLGLSLVRRLVPAKTLKPHTDVAAAIYAALGVVYGVILGQVVVAAWTTFQAAQTATTDEASSLVNLVRLAEAFPPAQQRQIEQDVFAYGQAVIDDEWPLMAQRLAPSPRAAAAMAALYRTYAGFASGQTGSLEPYAQSLTELDEVDDARGARLLASQGGLPDLLWAALLTVGAVTIGFAYLFGVDNPLVQHLMVAALAVVIALLLVLAQALSTPFQSPLQISPHDYERVLKRVNDSTPVAFPMPAG